MFAGLKSCPSMYIGNNGVYPASSPKSYSNLPRVSFGQLFGSAAMNSVFYLFSSSINLFYCAILLLNYTIDKCYLKDDVSQSYKIRFSKCME